MFIKFPQRDLTINLNKVSNIGFLDNKLKIVFNFSHSIDIEKKGTGEWATIADYKYIDCASEEEYSEFKKDVMDSMKTSGNFLMSSDSTHYSVNKSQISYVTTDSRKNRIIFNLSTSITKETHKGINVINDFVFWSFEDPHEFETQYQNILNSL